jgi:hypothetical protein
MRPSRLVWEERITLSPPLHSMQLCFLIHCCSGRKATTKTFSQIEARADLLYGGLVAAMASADSSAKPSPTTTPHTVSTGTLRASFNSSYCILDMGVIAPSFLRVQFHLGYSGNCFLHSLFNLCEAPIASGTSLLCRPSGSPRRALI